HLLIDAKEAIRGQFKWTEWRSEYLRDIPQTTASLYMRLAKNEDRLRRPDPNTDDGKRISNGLLILGAAGELSIKKAAALLVEKKPRGATQQRKRTDEDIATEWFKALERDDLLNWWRKLRGDDDLREYIGAATQALQPHASSTTSNAAASGVRRA